MNHTITFNNNELLWFDIWEGKFVWPNMVGGIPRRIRQTSTDTSTPPQPLNLCDAIRSLSIEQLQAGGIVRPTPQPTTFTSATKQPNIDNRYR